MAGQFDDHFHEKWVARGSIHFQGVVPEGWSIDTIEKDSIICNGSRWGQVLYSRDGRYYAHRIDELCHGREITYFSTIAEACAYSQAQYDPHNVV